MESRGWGQGWGLGTAGLISVLGAALWCGINPADHCDETNREEQIVSPNAAAPEG
jgi:hypothetical protein